MAQKSPPPARPITEDEAAARLGVSARTLQKWRTRGVGPAFIRLCLHGTVAVPAKHQH